MSVILNILVISLILLIAYWWSSQGFFSALLHLLAVMAAGALALAFWEPLAIDILLSGNTFDGYVPGLVLGGLFAIFLLILRGVSDSVVRANIMLGQAPDMALGGLMGLFAGTITIGFLLTAVGFMHGPHELVGYKGFGRQRGLPGEMGPVGPQLWVPVDQWTTELYEWMSVSTLYPDISGKPLRHYNPNLYMQASLLRDNTNDGEGQISMPPDGVKNVSLFHRTGSTDWSVGAEFAANAMDFGGQLVLSSSQVRIVGRAKGSSKPEIYHPTHWWQETPEGRSLAAFAFDDPANYATSIAGRKDADFIFLFSAPDSFDAEYIQIRGTRFDLSGASSSPGTAGMFNKGVARVDTRTLGLPIDEVVQVESKVRNFRPSTNRVKGMSLINKKFNSGILNTIRNSGGGTNRDLQVSGIYSQDGTRIVQVDVSKESLAWLGGKVDERTEPTDPIRVFDTQGRAYPLIGYYFLYGQKIKMELNRRDGISMSELPQFSNAPDEVLVLVFEVTSGVRLQRLQVGNVLVGTMNQIEIPPG